MATPAVVFVNQFLYDWHIGSLDYTDYIKRPSAQISKEKVDDDNDYYGYMGREQAQKYQNDDSEYTTIFDAENDNLTVEQIEHYRELERQSKAEGCPKYIPVMSFDNNFLINNGLMTGGRVDVQKIKDVSRKAINALVNTSKKLDASNVYWTADLHVNTDNVHVHFSLLEYHRLVDRQKVNARDGKDMIELKAFEKFKSTVANNIILEKRTPELTKFKRENLIPEFASSVTASKELLDLIKKLPPPKPKVGWQYSRKEIVPFHSDINKCIDKIIDSNEPLRRQFNHYRMSLQTMNNQYQEFYGDRVDTETLSYSENQMNDFYVRAGNKLLQALLDIRADKMAEGVSKKGEKMIFARLKEFDRDNDSDGAIEYLEKAKLTPRLSVTLGRRYLEKPEKEQQGIELLEKSLDEPKLDTHNKAFIHRVLADAYLKKKKEKEAEEHLIKSAESDDVLAQYKLSKFYLKKEEKEKSLEWLQRSADSGYAPAQCGLGLMLMRTDDKDTGLYYLGLAEKQNNPYAIRYLERLSELQNKNEMEDIRDLELNIGEQISEEAKGEKYIISWSSQYKKATKLIYKKNAKPEDYQQAEKLLLNEADKGNALALHDLGKMYLSGKFGNPDKQKSFEYYEKALSAFIEIASSSDLSEKMSNYVHYRIGKMYENGLGTEKNAELAYKYYKVSADAGYKYAEFSLANMYYYSNYVETDYSKAFKLYSSAAKKDMPYASFALGQMYANGEGVKKNIKESQYHYKTALNSFISSDNNNEADDNLLYKIGRMYKIGLGTTADTSTAFSYYKRSAELGNKNALYELGKCYITGDGVHRNTATGKDYLSKAIKLGNENAKRYLEYYSKRGHSKFYDYQAKKTMYAARHQMALCWSTIKQLLEEYERHIRELQEEFNEMNNVADDLDFIDYDYTL